MSKNHESILWAVTLDYALHGKAPQYLFRTRSAARQFLSTRFGKVTRAVWGPDNIKEKAK